jgi:DnaJ-class molecular chaperone
MTGEPPRLTCWVCIGRGWIRNGEIDDGMMTGRDSCPACRGTGHVTERELEAEVRRMREVAWASPPCR